MSVAKSAAISLSVKNIFRGRIDWLIEKGQKYTTFFIFIPDSFIVWLLVLNVGPQVIIWSVFIRLDGLVYLSSKCKYGGNFYRRCCKRISFIAVAIFYCCFLIKQLHRDIAMCQIFEYRIIAVFLVLLRICYSLACQALWRAVFS